MTIKDIQNRIKSGESVEHIIRQAIIALRAEPYHAVSTVFEKSALLRAQESDKRYQRGETLSPLDGVFFAVKDNIAVRGERMTCGSMALEHYISPYDAHTVSLLLACGAIPICSAQMDEFGMGSSGENCAFGKTLNPRNITRVPGGSSSGCAALTAANLVPFALGSDTGGSVRLPAAYCSISGFKPSRGVFSRRGLTAYSVSLETIGILAQSAADIEYITKILGQHDPLDATSTGLSERKIYSPRVGLLDNMLKLADSAIADRIEQFYESLPAEMKAGNHFILPDTDFIAPAYYIIACSEASADLMRFDGIRYGETGSSAGNLKELYAQHRSLLGAEVQTRIEAGKYVLSSEHIGQYFARAEAYKAHLSEAFSKLFEKTDLLILPVSPELPRSFDDQVSPEHEYALDLMCACANLCGLPAISLPIGRTEDGLPIGMQVVAVKGQDLTLFQFAKALQEGGRLFSWT